MDPAQIKQYSDKTPSPKTKEPAFNLHGAHTALVPNNPPVQITTGGFPPRVKRLGTETDRFSIQFLGNNVSNYTSNSRVVIERCLINPLNP